MSDPKTPPDYRKFRIVEVLLKEPVEFTGRFARRFTLAKVGTLGGAEVHVDDLQWFVPGVAVVAVGTVATGGNTSERRTFTAVLSIGGGDRVEIATADEPKADKPKAA